MAGMLRAIADKGKADIARDTAFEHAVSCGFGHYRIITKFDGSSFDQDIAYQRINDQFSVLWDSGAEEYDRRDAMHCTIAITMPKKRFEAMYPGKVATHDLPVPMETGSIKGWFEGDEVRLAEYFRKVPVNKKMFLLSDGRVIRDDEENFESVIDELAAAGITVEKTREIEDYKIEWAKCTGAEVLEGPKPWPGRFIPIVSVWGKESNSGEGKITYRSLIRYAHDSQKMFDFMRTAGIERAALEPKAPYVVGSSQIGNYAGIWKTANKRNHSFLPYDDTNNPTPPQRQIPPQPASGYFAEAAQAREDIKGSVGMYDASVGQRSNETSGKAILARQRESDVMSFPFIDNMGRSIQYEYEVVADLIPRVIDTRRAMRMLNSDETEARLVLYDDVLDEQTGQVVQVNDISIEAFDISVDVGPSYTTRRTEAAESMLNFIQAVEGAGALTGDLFAQTQDWPGAEDFAKRLKYLLPPEIREAEAKEQQGEEPLPMHIRAQMQQMEQMIQELQAALEELMPKMKEAEAKLVEADMGKEKAVVTQQMEKRAADLRVQQAALDFDERVMKLEKELDAMRDANREDVDDKMGSIMQMHQQLMAQLAASIANIASPMQDNASNFAEIAAQIAQSAQLIASYFTAARKMEVDENGMPTRLSVEGFGDVTIGTSPNSAFTAPDTLQ